MFAFGRESVVDTIKDKLKPGTIDGLRKHAFNNWREYERISFLTGSQIDQEGYSPWGPDHFITLPFLDAPPTTVLCRSCSKMLQQHWDPATGPEDGWGHSMPCGAHDDVQVDDPQELTTPSKEDKHPARETDPWSRRFENPPSVENLNALHSSARYCGICRASYYTVLRGYHPRHEERVGILTCDIRTVAGKTQRLIIDMTLVIDSSDSQRIRHKHRKCKGIFELYPDGGKCVLSYARRRLIMHRSGNHCSQHAK